MLSSLCDLDCRFRKFRVIWFFNLGFHAIIKQYLVVIRGCFLLESQDNFPEFMVPLNSFKNVTSISCCCIIILN